MKNPRKIFHAISYLQYPLLVAAFLFYAPFVLSLAKGSPDWMHLNDTLILMGVALSFSTLQDTTKTQNKFSKNIWEHPRKGKIAIVAMATVAFGLIIFGLSIFYFSKAEMTDSIAVGITVLGIGMVGLLKAAIEMFENHRRDRKPQA